MKRKNYCRLAAPLLLPLLLLTSCGDSGSLPKAPDMSVAGTKTESSLTAFRQTLTEKLYSESITDNYYRMQMYSAMVSPAASATTRLSVDLDGAVGFKGHGEMVQAGVKSKIELTTILESQTVYYIVSLDGTTVKAKVSLANFDKIPLPDLTGSDNIYAPQVEDTFEMIESVASSMKLNFNIFTYETDSTISLAAIDSANEANAIVLDFVKKNDKLVYEGTRIKISLTDGISMISGINLTKLNSKPNIAVPADADKYLDITA